MTASGEYSFKIGNFGFETKLNGTSYQAHRAAIILARGAAQRSPWLKTHISVGFWPQGRLKKPVSSAKTRFRLNLPCLQVRVVSWPRHGCLPKLQDFWRELMSGIVRVAAATGSRYIVVKSRVETRSYQKSNAIKPPIKPNLGLSGIWSFLSLTAFHFHI